MEKTPPRKRGRTCASDNECTRWRQKGIYMSYKPLPDEVEAVIKQLEMLAPGIKNAERLTPELNQLLMEPSEATQPYITEVKDKLIDYYSQDIVEKKKLFNALLQDLKVKELYKHAQSNHDKALAEMEKEAPCLEELLTPELAENFEDKASSLLLMKHLGEVSKRSMLKHQLPAELIIQGALNGDEESFFSAVALDAFIEKVPFFAQRIEIAEFSSDKGFINRLEQSRKERKDDKREDHSVLKQFLIILKKSGVLEKINREQLVEIIINRLRLYDEDHDESLKVFLTGYIKKIV